MSGPRSAVLAFATVVSWLPSGASAGIAVKPSIVVFEARSQSEQVITVTNSDDRIAYVTTEPRAVTAPGQTDEKLKSEPNPTLLGLVSSPNRLVLEPGERRGIRIVVIDPPGETDRVWRVKIAPTAGRIKEGQSGVAILVAYDALVIQRPANPVIRLVGSRAGRKFVLSNTGNSFAMVTAVRFCPAEGDCTALGSKRLYGGQNWEVDLPQDDGVVVVAYEGLRYRKEELRF